jgi:quercetin dioxygenase-like cupin family protein
MVSENEVKVISWPEERAPTEAELRQVLEGEGSSFYRWSNGPGDVYSAHTHSFHKVIYVVQGSIRFELPREGREVTVKVGDRLELPPGVLHNAVVGKNGVACLEVHRR